MKASSVRLLMYCIPSANDTVSEVIKDYHAKQWLQILCKLHNLSTGLQSKDESCDLELVRMQAQLGGLEYQAQANVTLLFVANQAYEIHRPAKKEASRICQLE